MHIHLIAVGKLKKGPERELVSRYLSRAARTGRQSGLSGFDTREIPEARHSSPEVRKNREAQAIRAACPADAPLIVLDETGKGLASRQLADQVARLNDSGTRNLCFIIGGPDGLAPELRQQAHLILALSPLTWPHQIARILVAEQLYRITTLLAGHPYHRD